MKLKISRKLPRYAIACIVILGIIFSITYGFRVFNSATTIIVLRHPKPGIECATIVSGYGSSIDCWKVDNE